MTLADRLNKIISEQNMTKREFAAKFGVTENYVYLLTGNSKNCPDSIAPTLAKLIALISQTKSQRLNIDSFLAQVKKYTEAKELDAEIIRALVERIDVFKPEKVLGTRTKKQTILIHWNFIGAVALPQEQKKSA